jgi:hypothetical protein
VKTRADEVDHRVQRTSEQLRPVRGGLNTEQIDGNGQELNEIHTGATPVRRPG